MAHIMGNTDKIRVLLVLEEGATASSVTTTLDMFRLAHRFLPSAGFLPRLCSFAGGMVRLADALTVETQPLPARFSERDVLILPGFFAESAGQIDHLLATTWRGVVGRLAGLPQRALVAASCHGTFVLAHAGLLNGHAATTAWWQAQAFSERYPRVRVDPGQALVDSGRVLTAGAMTAHALLCLHLLRRLGGGVLARQVGAIMLVDGARVLQQPFQTVRRQFDDVLVQRASDWLERNLARPVSLDELSSALHVSVRTLSRRFSTHAGVAPLTHLQALRIERAKELLADTPQEFDAITASCGYEDVSTFRRLFKRETGLTPAQYRQQFRQPTVRG